MKILHISYECYPFAKVGGMADVVGALPKYQNELGAEAAVAMPRYGMDWDRHGEWTEVFHGSFYMDWENIHYTVYRGGPDFDVFSFDIPGKFDRPQIYSYDDDLSRSIAFQRSVIHWLRYDVMAPAFKILHCHDHHTGLIPFMVANCLEFESMQGTPTVFTIHNAAYQGAFSRDSMNLLPEFPADRAGLIEWGRVANPLASALKCAWHFTTVSEGYLRELFDDGHGLESLIRTEGAKASGILNGIDADVWNPANDPYLPEHMKRSVDVFKRKNKANICKGLSLNPELPLYVFIGRLAYEKGADMLPSIVGDFAEHFDDIQCIILGSGDGK
ncbi:MAG: glycogen synthase, partial [Bacteroidetes bacterium]